MNEPNRKIKELLAIIRAGRLPIRHTHTRTHTHIRLIALLFMHECDVRILMMLSTYNSNMLHHAIVYHKSSTSIILQWCWPKISEFMPKNNAIENKTEKKKQKQKATFSMMSIFWWNFFCVCRVCPVD